MINRSVTKLGAGVKLFRLFSCVNYNMGLTDSAKAKIDNPSDMWDAINGESYKSKCGRFLWLTCSRILRIYRYAKIEGLGSSIFCADATLRFT